MTILKSSSEAPFLRKIGKFKIDLNLEIVQIRAFSKRSYEKTKGSLYFIFTSFHTLFSKLLSSYILSRFSIFSISYTRAKKVMHVSSFVDTVNFTIFQKVMHHSIPAAPISPPPTSAPGLLRGICRPFQSRGWGICKFCAARGPGICQPRGHSRAFVTHAVSYQNITTQIILLGKKADSVICHGQEKIEEVVKACS